MLTKRNATVSLCMIVRNEEHNLAPCLEPVADLFDQIVIVDTGSQDGTREVASRFTPHVFDFPWCDSFAAARNESLRHATRDWVFWLDADDRLSPESVRRLTALLDELDDRPRVFMMPVVSQWSDESEDAWVVAHPRLFKRSAELGWKGRVHEQLWPVPASIGYQILPSHIQIDHGGYQDAVLCHRKRQRKLRLLRMDYAENPDDPSTLYHLGVAYIGAGAIAEARKYLERLVQLHTGPAEYLRRVFCVLAGISHREGNSASALARIDQGLAWFPEDEQLLFTRAQIFYELQQHAAAIQILRKIVNTKAQEQWCDSAPAEIHRKLAPRLLGGALRMQGDYAGAEAVLLTALTQFPTDTQTWYNLGLVYLDAVDPQNLQGVLDRLLTCPQGSVFARLLRALWHLRHQQLTSAEKLIDELVAEAPRMALPRMLRAEWLSRRGAPLESQEKALRDLLRVDPSNGEAIHWLKQIEDARRSVLTPAAETFGTSIILSPGVAVG